MSTPQTIAKKLVGKFVVFDGPDGCGKTTQLRLLERMLAKGGASVVHAHDPGGTTIGDRIRHVLLDFDLAEMDVRCETLLFMASRAQLVSEVIAPALAHGDTVLCSRFISATFAYQGAAGYDVDRLANLGRWAVGDCWPDVTIVLDVSIETGFARTGRTPKHAGAHRKKEAGQAELITGARPDAMEARSMEFHRRVREIFLSLPRCYPAPVHVLDGAAEAQDVHTRVLELLERVDL